MIADKSSAILEFNSISAEDFAFLLKRRLDYSVFQCPKKTNSTGTAPDVLFCVLTAISPVVTLVKVNVYCSKDERAFTFTSDINQRYMLFCRKLQL